MSDHVGTTETGAAIIAKIVPPATVSIATVLGIQVSELVLWVTLVYTIILITHKLWQISKEFRK